MLKNLLFTIINMTVLDDAKRALQACEDGIALLTAQQKSNQLLVNDYNKRTLEVENKRKTYNVAKAEYDNKLANWTAKTGDYNNFKKYNGKNNQFWANETDGTCWWGENWNGAHEWCHNKANEKGYDGENYWAKSWGWCSGRYGNFLCKKADDVVENQIFEYNKVKPVFSEQWPPDAAPIVQNQTPVNIACCSNVTNVIGSEITDSVIQQQNNCVQSKRDAVTKAENEAKTPPPPPPAQTPPPQAQTPPPQAQAQPSPQQSAATKPSTKQAGTQNKISSMLKDKRMMVVIVIIILLILLSCFIVLYFSYRK